VRQSTFLCTRFSLINTKHVTWRHQNSIYEFSLIRGRIASTETWSITWGGKNFFLKWAPKHIILQGTEKFSLKQHTCSLKGKAALSVINGRTSPEQGSYSLGKCRTWEMQGMNFYKWRAATSHIRVPLQGSTKFLPTLAANYKRPKRVISFLFRIGKHRMNSTSSFQSQQRRLAPGSSSAVNKERREHRTCSTKNPCRADVSK
jgi:hypothetical protein